MLTRLPRSRAKDAASLLFVMPDMERQAGKVRSGFPSACATTNIDPASIVAIATQYGPRIALSLVRGDDLVGTTNVAPNPG